YVANAVVRSVLTSLSAKTHQVRLLSKELNLIADAQAAGPHRESKAKELASRRLRLFEASERVHVEAAVLRYITQSAQLSQVKLNSVQVETPRQQAASVIRVLVSFEAVSEYRAAIQFLRLLQAPLIQVETLRIAAALAPNTQDVSVTGKIAFYGSAKSMATR
ncbi:MAG TPA: hypothetical protein VGD49_06270, partial [Longimicrobiales bacterium]